LNQRRSDFVAVAATDQGTLDPPPLAPQHQWRGWMAGLTRTPHDSTENAPSEAACIFSG
jgi:hypothetical protein